MNITNYLFGSSIIVLFVLCSGLGLLFVRNLKKWRNLTQHHEVMGYFFPVAGSIYGVLLGLIVVNSMALFDKAQETINEECNNLISIYILAESQPKGIRDQIRELCRDYAYAMTTGSWESLHEIRHEPKSGEHVLDLFLTIIRISDSGSSSASAQLLSVANDLWKARRERIDIAMHKMPNVVWFVLCAGGILIILFSYMFVMDSLLVQVTSTLMLSALIALNLYLVVLFETPFSGDLTVSNQPFVSALSIFEQRL